MIQIDSLPTQPVQPAVQASPAASAQQTDQSGNPASFQSMMQNSANRLNSSDNAKAAKAEKAKPGAEQEKDADKTVPKADVQVIFQMLQALQPIADGVTPLQAVIPQTAGGTQTAAGNPIGAVTGNTVPAQNSATPMDGNMPNNTANVPVSTGQNTTAGTPVPTQATASNPVASQAPATDSANIPMANTATENAPTVQNNPAVPQNNQPVQANLQVTVQTDESNTWQANSQVTAQTAESDAGQAIPVQNSVIDTPVQNLSGLQAVQMNPTTGSVENVVQSSPEKLTFQTANPQVQTNGQAKPTSLPLAVKAVDTADEKSAANQQNDAGYAQMLHSGNVVIPISDSSASIEKPAPVQLTDTITQNLREGKKEFQVDLFPKDLGKVSVKLASENGILTVEILAANPKTQSLLLSGSSEIKSILQASVNQPVQVVDASPNKQAYHGEQQQNNQSNARQQQQQEDRQHRSYHAVFDSDDGIRTVDFLSVMQQLSINA